MDKVTSMTRILMLAFFVSLVTSLHAQSLADAAREAGEKRAAAASAQTSKPKVYTRKEVEALPPEVVTPRTMPDTKESAAAPEAPESIDSAGPVKDEAYWKKRMAPLQASLERDLRGASAVRVALGDVQVHMLPNQWNWSVYGNEWLRLTKELETWEAMIRDDQRAIAALEEEGRVAGALPGWLR